MINSKAMGNFMNHTIAIRHKFKLVKKKRLYHLFALDKNIIKSKNKQMII